MVGSRCTFRDCQTHIKSNIRLFPFPLRDRPRCLQWLANAKRLKFHALPVDALRTKAICALHFEDKYFMNCKKLKLTHHAVPTLDNDGKDVSVDVQSILDSSAQSEVLNISNEIKIEQNSIDLDKPDVSLTAVDGDTFRISELPPPPTEPDVVLDIPLVSHIPPKRKREKDESFSKKRLTTYKRSQDKYSNSDSNNLTYVVSENGELIPVPESKEQPTLLDKNFKLEQKTDDPSGPITYSICVDEELRNLNGNSSQSDTQPVLRNSDASSENKILNSTEDFPIIKSEPLDEFELIIPSTVIQEIQNAQKLPDPATTRLPTQKKVSATHRKQKIFREVSDSINPMLASLLKMDLFGRGTARESAIRLYQSTPEGYQILLQHWGLKLPPVNIVKKWARNEVKK